MDSFITWEGIVATAALAVSLYSLRQVRRAPAMARQRELQDQLRAKLEESAAQVKAVQKALRHGSIELPDVMVFMEMATKIT